MMPEKFKTAWAVFLSLAIVHAYACILPTYAAVKKGSDEDQIQRMESRLNEEARKLGTFQSKEAHLLTLVAELERQVADTKKETEALTLNVQEVSERLDAQKEKLEELKSVLEHTELQIGEYLRSLYKYSRRGNFRILASAHAIGELQRRIKYVGIVTQKDRKNLHSLTDRASDCQNEISKTEAAILKTESALKEKSSRLVFLETSLEEKVLLLMKIHEEKEFYETSVEELETAVEDLKRALNQTGREDLYTLDPSLNFEDCKGRLPLPFPGRIVSNRQKIGVALAKAKGVVIQADADSAVRAVFRGEVVYSGHLKGYGEVVIVNHGGRFFTVSAHLSKREKAKGDRVRGGDILGWVNDNGAGKGASMYFEVRKADRKLNPTAWLKQD